MTTHHKNISAKHNEPKGTDNALFLILVAKPNTFISLIVDLATMPDSVAAGATALTGTQYVRKRRTSQYSYYTHLMYIFSFSVRIAADRMSPTTACFDAQL